MNCTTKVMTFRGHQLIMDIFLDCKDVGEVKAAIVVVVDYQ